MTIAALMKRVGREALARRGRQVAPATTPAEVREVLDLLRPMATTRELIRVGGPGDGGYLVPDDLEDIDACFSPGVSTHATFEEELAGRGIRSFLADYSVDGPPAPHPLIHFEKKYLGLVNDDTYVTLDDWVGRHGPFRGDLILQMDIEGAEYDVILDTSNDTWRRFRIVVIEFHGLDRQLGHPVALRWLRAAVIKLRKTFDVVHLHPNNTSAPVRVAGHDIPPVLEVSLLRRDRTGEAVPAMRFPHPLDATNVPGQPDHALPASWFAP